MLIITAATLFWNCTDHNVQTSNYELDASKSVAEWKGYLKTGYFNEGSIAVKSENLFIKDGKIAGGSFIIPLSSILNFNLPTQEVKEQLVHHLQSPDFLNMALHPDLKFEIKDITACSG